MSEFYNTVDSLGDDEVCDRIIQNTLTEYSDNHITFIGSFACYSQSRLTSIDFPNVKTIDSYAFGSCSKLKTVNLQSVETIENNVFNNCYGIETIYVPNLINLGRNAFQSCRALTYIDFPALTSMGDTAFMSCTALTTVILRSNTMCKTTTGNVFENTPIANGTGYIYVPAALVDTYASGTNWSAYSTQFRAIEDYPDIVGG